MRPSPTRRRGAQGPRLLAVAAAVLALGLALGGRPPQLVQTGDADAAAGGLAVRGVEAGEGSPRSRDAGRAPSPPSSLRRPPPRLPVTSSAWPPPEDGADAVDGDAPAPGARPPGPGEPAPGGAATRGADVARGEDAAPEPDIVVEGPDGFGVVAGTASAGTGEPRTFTVEVEDGFEAHAPELLETTRSALLDTESSWARDHALAQVEDPTAADVRVVLASPATVDERCGAAGLDTEGDSSCWDGERAMLNGDRWRDGVDHVDDLETYRTYLVNHEVGHGLGRGHVDCPEPGAPAPVMMQQTLGLDGCRPNPWPYP